MQRAGLVVGVDGNFGREINQLDAGISKRESEPFSDRPAQVQATICLQARNFPQPNE